MNQKKIKAISAVATLFVAVSGLSGLLFNQKNTPSTVVVANAAVVSTVKSVNFEGLANGPLTWHTAFGTQPSSVNTNKANLNKRGINIKRLDYTHGYVSSTVNKLTIVDTNSKTVSVIGMNSKNLPSDTNGISYREALEIDFMGKQVSNVKLEFVDSKGKVVPVGKYAIAITAAAFDISGNAPSIANTIVYGKNTVVAQLHTGKNNINKVLVWPIDPQAGGIYLKGVQFTY